MTKENRERAYLHFRDEEKNYVALDHLNKGITATQRMREEAKKNADAILFKNPELAELEKPVEVVEEKTKKIKKISKEE